MNQSTVRLIALLNEGWVQRPMSETTARMWAPKLERFPPDVVEEAISTLLEKVEWRPNIAAILRECRSVQARRIPPQERGGHHRLHESERPALMEGEASAVGQLCEDFLKKLEAGK